MTSTFQNNQGVKQGIVLSPFLFNIFLADFSNFFEDSINLMKMNEEDSLSCIIWADDYYFFPIRRGSQHDAG